MVLIVLPWLPFLLQQAVLLIALNLLFLEDIWKARGLANENLELDSVPHVNLRFPLLVAFRVLSPPSVPLRVHVHFTLRKGNKTIEYIFEKWTHPPRKWCKKQLDYNLPLENTIVGDITLLKFTCCCKRPLNESLTGFFFFSEYFTHFILI